MAHWVHCNKCNTRLQPDKKFFLFECGDIICDSCRSRSDGKCPVCEKTSNTIQLSNEMAYEIQQYFLPMEVSIRKLIEISEFQNRQKDHYLQVMVNKYNYAKNECIKIHKAFQKAQKENHLLKSGINPQGFITSTPRTHKYAQSPGMSAMSSVPGLITPASSAQSIPHMTRGPPGFAHRFYHRGGQHLPNRNLGSSAGSVNHHRPTPSKVGPGSMSNRPNMPGIHMGTMSSLDELRRPQQ